MKKVLEYSKIVVLLLGLLVGVQIPGFVDEYRLILESRALESSLGLAEFRNDAERFFDGDLDRLVAYYESREDEIIVAGGQSIRALVDRNLMLTNGLIQFNASLAQAYYQVFLSPLIEVQEQLRDSYQYSVALNSVSIGSGIGLGLLCLILFELILAIISLTILRCWRSARQSKTQQLSTHGQN
jgi:hypothetical protein